MTETQVGFLYKVASSLHRQPGDSKNLTLLRSYYLMRCKNITKGYGLPEKHFSSKVRCSKCCIEWNKDTKILVKPLKLSKKQRHRIRSQKATKTKKELIERRKQLLNSNEIEQFCSFCKQTTVTTIIKPAKIEQPVKSQKESLRKTTKNVKQNKTLSKTNNSESAKAKKTEDNKSKINSNSVVNVYSLAKDVFSLSNEKNNLSSAIQEKKVIKNNKKKKDKFAGLCEKAVLATAKIKEHKDKQNKLNLFLKPSL